MKLGSCWLKMIATQSNGAYPYLFQLLVFSFYVCHVIKVDYCLLHFLKIATETKNRRVQSVKTLKMQKAYS